MNINSPVQNTVSALGVLSVTGVAVSAEPVLAAQPQQPVAAVVASVQLLLLLSATAAAVDAVSDAASVTAAVPAAAVDFLESVELRKRNSCLTVGVLNIK
jgi:hypothetical protein